MAELSSTAEEGDIWIGGTRKGGDSFYWLDGTPWNYTNWSPPNPSGGAEECLEIFARNYHPSEWNDVHCWKYSSFVCQLPESRKKGGIL